MANDIVHELMERHKQYMRERCPDYYSAAATWVFNSSMVDFALPQLSDAGLCYNNFAMEESDQACRTAYDRGRALFHAPPPDWPHTSLEDLLGPLDADLLYQGYSQARLAAFEKLDVGIPQEGMRRFQLNLVEASRQTLHDYLRRFFLWFGFQAEAEARGGGDPDYAALLRERVEPT